MSVALNDTQIAEVTTGGSTRYEKTAWPTYLAKIVAAGKSVGQVQDDFPGVKPAHVTHMLRLTLKADAELAKKVELGKHPQLGIVLKVR